MALNPLQTQAANASSSNDAQNIGTGLESSLISMSAEVLGMIASYLPPESTGTFRLVDSGSRSSNMLS